MSDQQKKPTPGYSPACINPEAVFWLNASPETRQRIIKAGGGAPVITGDDQFVAAQQRAQQAAPTPKP